MNVRFSQSRIIYQMKVSTQGNNLVRLYPPFPDVNLTSGFEVLTKPEGGKVFGNYLDYTTIYREMDDGSIILSNDGSVYVPPAEPEPPEPYVPTMEEIIEQKVAEMNTEQQQTIQNGVDVLLTSGKEEHFTLKDQDQTSLMGLQTRVLAGDEYIPWHNSNEAEHCKFYSNADMALITSAAMYHVTYHVTYFRDLRIYIRSMKTKEEVESVYYGMEIPSQFQSEPLMGMLAANQ